MGNYGFKIAQAGFDVGTASDQHLVMTSKLSSYKIQTSLQGTAAITLSPSTGGTITVIHNLGYIPAYDAWFSDETGSWHTVFENNQIFPSGTPTTNLFANTGTAQTAGTANIFINLFNRGTVSRIGSIYYIIFVDSIT